jgi:hypothetical protein
VERDVQIEVKPNGYGTVVVDGVDISPSVSGLTMDVTAGHPPQIAVFLRLPSIVLDGKLHPNPRLTDTERAALVALGWTPPPEDA